MECDFIESGWDSAVPKVYKCEVKPSSLFITTRKNSTIKKINEKSILNEKINAIRIFEQICNFFPKGVEKFFKNIEAVAIQNSHLKDLTKSDLKDLKKLKSLSLFGNELEALEFGIFDENLKLEFLSVYENKILTVGSEILSPLKNLKKAFFHTNKCVNFDAASESEMKILMEKLDKDCEPSFELVKIKVR